MKTNLQAARKAGLLFLATALTSAFHFLYVRPSIFVPKNAAATFQNLIAHESLFRIGIISVVISQIFFLFLGFALRKLFYSVNRERANRILTFISFTVALALINSLTNFGALLMASGTDYLSVFSEEERKGFAMLFLKLNNYGQGIVEIFWGLWFFTFGMLVLESKYLPKALGVLMVAACFGYLINIFFVLFLPHYHTVYLTMMAMTLGGLATFPTILWLIVKGIKEEV